jgi:hypothetical protein
MIKEEINSRLKSHMLATIQSRTFKIHKTIILPMVLYGCETWSLTLREEHGLGSREQDGG